MSRFWLTLSLCGLLCIVSLPSEVLGRVKLITLPVRQRVDVQLDHPSATLVQEQRIVPLVKGINQVDFSWAGTRIDPGTIVFRVLGAGETDKSIQANVLSVSYPPGENSLVWQVSASASGSATVRISYLLGGLDKSFNYRAVAEHDEKTLTLRQYLRVKNFAGEEYADSAIHIGYGGKFQKPIGINETKEMLVETSTAVPIKKTYTCNPAKFGYLDNAQKKLNVPMHYVIKNDGAHKLGKTPLPYGKVRIFQKDGRGSTVFLGEDWGAFTPIDDQMELYLGLARDIAVKRTIERRDRSRDVGNLGHYDVVVKYEIENFKDTPATLNIVEQIAQLATEIGLRSGRPIQWSIGKQTTFVGDPDPEKTDQHRVQFAADLPARQGDKAEKIIYKLHLVFGNEW